MVNRTKKITVGLVGVGYWGSNYLRVLGSLAEVQLKYVCDIDKTRLVSGNSGTEGAHLTHDIETLLEDENLQAVVIATPASTHYDIVRMMLKSGKNVLVEKPLTMDYVQAKELCRLSRKVNLALMVGHVYCFNPAMRYIKRLVESGQLGDLYYGIGLRLGLGPIRSDASCTWDLATHDISALDFVLGQMPNQVSARAATFLQTKDNIYDYGNIELKYESGFRFGLMVSWYAAEKTRTWYLMGSRRMLRFDDMMKDAPLIIYNKGLASSQRGGELNPALSFAPRQGNAITPHIEVVEPLTAQVRHFIECVRTGKSPLTDCEQGSRVVRILEAVENSSRGSGSPVKP